MNLYSADQGARTLLVGFCGWKARLSMPVSLILEALDSTEVDLLLLADLRQRHFDGGIEGYARSLPELMDKIGTLALRRGYGASITYGCSMGGIPALRGGGLLGAAKAISVGGRFAWHPSRIESGDEYVNAFDLLCHCRAPMAVPSYLLYSEANPQDVEGAAMFAAISPASGRIAFPGRKHNFPYHIKLNGKLASYFSQLLDLEREPDPAQLRALLE